MTVKAIINSLLNWTLQHSFESRRNAAKCCLICCFEKIFSWDTADFYQIFFHKKQIIHHSESQPYIKNKKKVSIPNFFDTCHHTAHNTSHHTHTICKRAELMSKPYKNGLFLKKIHTKVQKSVFMKKSVLVGTNPYKWEHCIWSCGACIISCCISLGTIHKESSLAFRQTGPLDQLVGLVDKLLHVFINKRGWPWLGQCPHHHLSSQQLISAFTYSMGPWLYFIFIIMWSMTCNSPYRFWKFVGRYIPGAPDIEASICVLIVPEYCVESWS